MCFLFFNVGTLIGVGITFKLKRPGPQRIWIPVVLRTLFVPLFLFCNFKPDKRSTPVLFPYDSVHGIFSLSFALTHGYLKALLIDHISSKSKKDKVNVEIAMKLTATFMQGGNIVGFLVAHALSKLATV